MRTRLFTILLLLLLMLSAAPAQPIISIPWVTDAANPTNYTRTNLPAWWDGGTNFWNWRGGTNYVQGVAPWMAWQAADENWRRGSNYTAAVSNALISIISTNPSSQTPWTSDINGAGHSLSNANSLTATNTITATKIALTGLDNFFFNSAGMMAVGIADSPGESMAKMDAYGFVGDGSRLTNLNTGMATNLYTVKAGTNITVQTNGYVYTINATSGTSGTNGLNGTNGAQGVPGTAATIAAGSVYTNAPGSAAGVTNRGTSSAAIFDFTLPVGPQGVPGTNGAVGAQGPPGTNTLVTVVTNQITYTTNYWSGPTNTVNIGGAYDLNYTTTTPVAITGITGKPVTNTCEVMLSIYNASGSNVSMTYPAGMVDGNWLPSQTISNQAVGVFWIRYTPVWPRTNVVMRGM